MSVQTRPAARLEGRAELLDGAAGPPDLLGFHDPDGGFFFEHGATGVVGVGAAATIVVPAGPNQVERAADRAEEALRAFHADGGPGPVVVGALPFDGLTPATLVIPRTAVSRLADGRVWRLTVGPDADADADTGRGAGPAGSVDPRRDAGARTAAPLEVTSVPEPRAFVHAVEEARRRIHAGRLEKVVLARMLVARADHAFDRLALLARLRASEPDGYVFAVHGFLGASPELLVARDGVTVTANALAGTAARRSDPSADAAVASALLASAKDRREHDLVVDAVRDALGAACDELDVDDAPSAVRTSAVWHLSTRVRGTLRAPAPSSLRLASLLHPTPAVCGTPRDAATAAIRELEAIDRTLYAGVVGWMDARGDGEWAVALRCAEVQGRIALLFAGAGIVADSDPAAELDETDAKFRSMLNALGYA